jgi:hypothetical protein
VRLLSTLGRPWPTVSDANAFARSRAGVLRSREEEEEGEKKKTTTSRYTIPQRNGCPATAITPRCNCVLIRCLNIHLMLLSTYPLLYLELATHFSNAFCTLSLYYGLFNDFLNGRKVHPECHMTFQRKSLSKVPRNLYQIHLLENMKEFVFDLLIFFFLNLVKVPQQILYFF